MSLIINNLFGTMHMYYSFSPTIASKASRKNGQSDSVVVNFCKGVMHMGKKVEIWFEGFNISLGFITLKFKKPTNVSTESGKVNNF